MEYILMLIEIIGIISFSASGAMVAIDKETDFFGVIILSLLTSFGGGLTRDIVLGQGLPAFFEMQIYITISVATAMAIFCAAALFKREYVSEEEGVNKINNVLDALGIGVFAAVGAEMYIEHGPLVAIFAGTISSVGGSLIRDVILRDVPFILRKRIYAVAVIIGASLYYVFETYVFKDLESSGVFSTLICVVAVFTIRMCATKFKWNMPKAIRFDAIKASGEEETEQDTVEKH
jgi:uncharacterized membrane protein YeiH